MAKIGIGVDVGGTSVKLGMFTRTGNLIKKWEIPTDRENNCANVLPDVAASIRETLEEEGFSTEDLVGVGECFAKRTAGSEETAGADSASETSPAGSDSASRKEGDA